LTAFASSIGIIGIAVILSLSSGFKEQILKFQGDALQEFPIMISQSASTVSTDGNSGSTDDNETMKNKLNGTVQYEDTDRVYLYDSSKSSYTHKNVFTEEYMSYLKNISPDICSSLGYTRIVSMNLVRKVGDEIKPISFSSTGSSMGKNSESGSSGSSNAMTSTDGIGLSSYPEVLSEGQAPYLESNYDLLSGQYPQSTTDLVLVVDTKNRTDYTILKQLGFDTDNVDSITFDKIVGTEFKIVTNNDYYVKTPVGSYVPGNDYQSMYNSSNSITVKISGVVRVKPDVKIGLLGTGIAYSDALSQMVIDSDQSSDIVKAQKDSDKNVITMADMDADTKQTTLSYLGGNATPYMIMVFPDTFEHKDAVLSYLDAYNNGKDKADQVVYTDLAKSMSSMTSGIMDGITVVLVAFASISLVVSLIMICIITYTSVLERTKEIGILRALGARKKDITRVFDAETCILGIFSGVLGIVLAWALTFPINAIIYKMTDLSNVAILRPNYAVTLIIISTVLTVIGGHIPARMASKRDAVEALRSE
jgi:putative ABC transport system permease protein